MRKFTAVLLCLVLAVCIAACGKTPAPAATEAPAEATAAPAAASPTPAPTETPEILYVENGVLKDEKNSKTESETELTFEGTVNIFTLSSITVTGKDESRVFAIADGTVFPYKLAPGDYVSLTYTEARSGCTAKVITLSENKPASEILTVTGCVIEATNNSCSLAVDGKTYSFVIDSTSKVNLNYFDTGDFIKVTYSGVILGTPVAIQIDPVKVAAPAQITSAPQGSSATPYPVIIVTPNPNPKPTAVPAPTVAPNPMKSGSGTVVSWGGNVCVIRMSGSSNDAWFSVASNAGGSPAPGDYIHFTYNSSTDTITSIG